MSFFLDALRRQHAHTRSVYGTPLVGVKVTPRPAKIPAHRRRLNRRLWNASDWRWWRKLTPLQQRGYAFGAMNMHAVEIGMSQREQAKEIGMANIRGAAIAFHRARREAELRWWDRQIAKARRKHRPIRELVTAKRIADGRWLFGRDYPKDDDSVGFGLRALETTRDWTWHDRAIREDAKRRRAEG